MIDHKFLNVLNNMSSKVKDSFKKNGIIVPVKTDRGIKIENYEIVKVDQGYTIFNSWGEIETGPLNYLKTAVVIANNLAFKKLENKQLVLEDRIAGSTEFDSRLFEQRLSKSLKINDEFGINFYSIRMVEAKEKHKRHIHSINSQYDKLIFKLKMLEKSNK